MIGEDNSFDSTFYNELVSCIGKYNLELVDVVNAEWKWFKTYAKTGGNPGVDDWIRCDQYGVRILLKTYQIFWEGVVSRISKDVRRNIIINISTAFSRT